MNDDEMNYIQACLEFAAQLGQIADDTLEAVERRRILENEKRKELLEKGITVYGPVSYTHLTLPTTPYV